jgi:D-3-phosphoglycerate dehydrogenase
MSNAAIDSLVFDLLEWLSKRDRSYEEVMEAWRTSCPKLPAWEEANERGFVVRESAGGRSVIRVTESGRTFLEQGRLR